jgi:hypothetical protein
LAARRPSAPNVGTSCLQSAPADVMAVTRRVISAVK